MAKCTLGAVNIGIVPQGGVLFNDTIEYNIGFGKFGQGYVPREECTRATAAQFEKFVNGTPSGATP